MKRALVLLLVVTALSACARSGSSDRPTGGISGVVVAGPTCPVETIESPCPPGLWTGTVRATAADGTMYEVGSDDAGRYTLLLPPGSYTVVAVTEGGGPPTGIPSDVTVAQALVTLDLEVDTGIR
jgi:hypothetical protein